MNYCNGAITFGTHFQTFYIIQNYEEIAELLGRVRQKYESKIYSFFVTLHHKLFSFTSVRCVQNLLMTGHASSSRGCEEDDRAGSCRQRVVYQLTELLGDPIIGEGGWIP